MNYECRICFDTDDNINNFISPCCCNGQSKHVHKECLSKWINTNKGNDKFFKCEVCHCKYLHEEDEIKNEAISKKSKITSLFLTTLSFSLVIILLILANEIGRAHV